MQTKTKNGILVFFIAVILEFITRESGAIFFITLLSAFLTAFTKQKFLKIKGQFYCKLTSICLFIIYFLILISLCLIFISDGIEYHTLLNDCRVIDTYNRLKPSFRELSHIEKYHT